MCDFISWVEVPDQQATNGRHVLFLTDREVFSPRGRELFGANPGNYDVLGHGAIRRFYAPPGEESLVGGLNCEVRDFWEVERLPPEIQALHPEDPESFLRHWGRIWDTPGCFKPDDLGYLLTHAPGHWNEAMREHAPRNINGDADPFIPYESWTVEEHRPSGHLVWDPTQVQLYLSDGQKDDRNIFGHDLRQKLQHQPVLNANVLDHLIAHPHLIPKEWQSKNVFFWGTVYRDRNGDLYVRLLHWDDYRWRWSYCWLDVGWFGDLPAAVLAS
ncbi:hypothetical protein KKF05_04045 [Patescibacteria group bacterium]|nr:hypothetical protein [Patescibacteria group bacterium]MBU1915726.1 hypothetical protein [Patescibacteria group bacterium]